MEYSFSGVVYNVVDGDTVDAEIDLGFKIKIKQRLRLAGINTPEKGDQGYAMAAARLKALALGKTVTIKTHKPSKFGYFLADLYADDRHINATMISEGFAHTYSGGHKPS